MNRHLRWHQAVTLCERSAEPYALVTVLGAAGSVPREPASKMVITGEHVYDTVGGGHLEYQICQQARAMLARQQFTSELAHFPLGASLGQCCGGSVSVLIETLPGCEQQLVVFGAGHVARALMAILAELPWQITWVDQRADQFPDTLPGNVRIHHTDDPVGDAPALCAGRQVLILTHNHQLDFELCRGLLDAGNASGIGLIGSATKAERFRQRLQHRGYPDESIGRIRCPVGRPDVPGKRPMEVAVSIIAELLTLTHTTEEAPATRRGIPWRQLRGILNTTESGETQP